MQERLQLRIRERTFSVWRFLNTSSFVNHLYSPLKNQVRYFSSYIYIYIYDKFIINYLDSLIFSCKIYNIINILII